MKTLRISIIGFGSVGQGVARVISMKQDYLQSIGIDLKVVAIVDSKGCEIESGGIDLSDALERKATTGTVALENKDSIFVINNVEHDIVVDTTPTNTETGEPGLSNILTAFEHKRHVVTSSKGPLVVDYKTLAETASKNNVEFRYEATVGGAMPVLNLARDALAGNKIERIEGILNGTCNYILSRMAEQEGYTYEDVLSEALGLGIAETDPSSDVEGYDAACKVVILANSIFNMDARFEDVDITGITRITPEALKLAADHGYVIKLIGVVRESELSVSPKLVPKGHPLSVSGTLNVASVQTQLAGHITVSGPGAGSIETASAILSDIISIYRTQ
ncbi:MAG: homoserine dehydrogenase [Methanosarcinales archaeon]|nr:homoserine dehydrogenase [Methanosarcinales archaeon]